MESDQRPDYSQGFENAKAKIKKNVLRLRKGKSQILVCEHSGISVFTLQQIEAARANPTIQTLCILAQYFGTDINGLLKG